MDRKRAVVILEEAREKLANAQSDEDRSLYEALLVGIESIKYDIKMEDDLK